jgi:hypothetical protein
MRNVVLVLLASALLTTSTDAQQGTSSRASANSTQKRAARASSSPFKLAASVQQVMTAITIPASDVIFEAAGATTKDTAWDNIQNSALTLAESGNLLMLPGRAPDNQEWVKQSQAMIDAAMLAFDAAAKRNADQLSISGDKIYATCEGCHNKYMNKTD